MSVNNHFSSHYYRLKKLLLTKSLLECFCFFRSCRTELLPLDELFRRKLEEVLGVHPPCLFSSSDPGYQQQDVQEGEPENRQDGRFPGPGSSRTGLRFSQEFCLGGFISSIKGSVQKDLLSSITVKCFCLVKVINLTPHPKNNYVYKKITYIFKTKIRGSTPKEN